MRIVMLTEEDKLYLPPTVGYFLEHCEHEVIKVCVLKNPTTSSLKKTLKTFVSAFGLVPLFSYAQKMLPVMVDKIRYSGKSPAYSVKNTVLYWNKPYQYVENVNSANFIAELKEAKPDLIVAISPTQILGQEVLSTPTHGCINIHSSKLPQHRGLYPVFWTMSEDASESAVSVHYIAEGIDAGDVLLQREVPLDGIQSMHEALQRSKRAGVQLLLEAVGNIANGEDTAFAIDCSQGSYHSFPTRQAYVKFRKAGYRLW